MVRDLLGLQPGPVPGAGVNGGKFWVTV